MFHPGIGDILAPGQKWHNYETDVVVQIDKVNTMNSTFAGTYTINNREENSRFPIRGEFDPNGVTIGWVVSYWNRDVNDHALGAWAGYAKVESDNKSVLSMTRLIAHEDNMQTTIGYGTYVLE